MTDTTDIKALREACAQWVRDTIGEVVDTRMALNGDGNDYMSWDMSVIWLAWQHLSGKLEAERQRADNASFRENHLNDMLNDKIQQNVDLRAELAALKGDKVPVAWCITPTAGRGSYVETNTEFIEKLGELAFRVEPLFPTPQKPVVCLKSGYLHKSEVIDAIEAAGCVVSFSDERLMQDMSGIVKDGE